MDGRYKLDDSVPWYYFKTLTRTDKIDISFRINIGTTTPIKSEVINNLDKHLLRVRRNLVAVVRVDGKEEIFKPRNITDETWSSWIGKSFDISVRLYSDAVEKVRRPSLGNTPILPSQPELAAPDIPQPNVDATPASSSLTVSVVTRTITNDSAVIRQTPNDILEHEPRDVMKELFGSDSDSQNVDKSKNESSSSSSSSSDDSSSDSSSTSDSSSSESEN